MRYLYIFFLLTAILLSQSITTMLPGDYDPAIEDVPILSSDPGEVYVAQYFNFIWAYPNPFNAGISLGLTTPSSADLQICIYDLYGRVIASFSALDQSAGRHTYYWNGHDDTGQEVPSGIYLYV